MDKEYEITISLDRYDNLIESEFKLEQILDILLEAINDTEKLRWDKKELDVPEYLIPILKLHHSWNYNSKLKELKEKANDKQE